MRNNAIFKKSKSKILSILLLTLILILSSVCAIACADVTDDESEYDPDFTYSEHVNDDDLISNSDFTQGLTEVENDAYPNNSITGWSFTTDTGATSSAVKSGVVNTTDDMWKTAIVSLLDDDDFLNYVKAEYADVDFEDKTDEEIAEAIISATNGFASPKRTGDDVDDVILMVNNISSKTTVDKIGSAQSVSSTSSVTLEKDEYAKITVSINTHKKLTGNSDDFGANVRISTTVNSITQAQYAISNIVTDGEWKDYTIYVKGNNYTSSSINIALGLGFGDKSGSYLNYAYGVAFFDNVKVEKIEKTEYDTAIGTNVATESSLSATTYNGDPSAKRINAINNTFDYFYDLSFNLDAYLTETNTLIAGDNSFADGANASFVSTAFDTSVSGEVKVTLNKQVAGIKLTKSDGSNFTVSPEGFTTLKFSVKNNLSNYSTDAVNVYLVDENSNSAKPNKTLIATASQQEEDDGFITFTITVKNNFPDNTTGDRSFYILVIAGVSTPQENTENTFFPKGDVTVKGLSYVEGLVDNCENNKNYLYVESLSSGNVDTFGTYSLYAGNSEDYAEEDDEVVYNIKVSELNKHNINTEVVDALDYTGVVANHRYVKENGEETAVNTSATAGVINSKNLANYATDLPNVDTALGTVTEKDGIQPLVIYNASATSYGFIGKSNKLSSSSTAKVTLKIKVDNVASAYVYIVNMNNDSDKLNVYTHTVNETENALAVKVTNTNGEWKTISFYIASGADDMNYRIEMWNGSRDGLSASAGYVFVNDIEISTFTENEEKSGHLTTGSVLKTALDEDVIEYVSETDNKIKNGILHTRALTELEKQFNEEYPDQKVTYDEKYVWVSNKNADGEGSFVYAIYNTVNPVTTDPYDSITEEEEETEEESGCSADFDSATFWLQFSTILLSVLLIGSILILVLRTIRRRTKKASKIKARYNVKSRNQTLAKLEKAKQERLAKAKAEKEEEENLANDLVNTVDGDDDADDTEYTYGEVLEDFGDDVVVDGNEVELPNEVEENVEVEEAEESPVETETKDE